MVGICMSLKTKILLLCLCFHAVEIPAEAAFGKVQATVSLLYAIFFFHPKGQKQHSKSKHERQTTAEGGMNSSVSAVLSDALQKLTPASGWNQDPSSLIITFYHN